MRAGSVAVVLAVALLAPDASAASTARIGASCSPRGAVRSANGQQFICVKSGGKLVWSKRVTPTPAGKSPVPSATNTTPAVVPPSGSPEQVKALALMKAAMTPKTSDSPVLRYHFSPNAVPSFKDFLVKDLDRSMAYWGAVYDNPEPFNVFYGTAQDLGWLIEAWKPYGFDKNGGFADDLRGRIAREGVNLNAGAVPSESGPSHLSILRSSTRSTQSGDYSFITHEAVHIIQQYLSQSRTEDFPCWLREGSANLFGNFMSVEFHDTSYDVQKRGNLNTYRWGTSGVELRSFTAEQWLAHIKEMEASFSGTCDYTYRFAYGTGLLLSEALMADFGFSKMMDFWRSFATAKGLRRSFSEVYGVELDDWYASRGVPYVMREYARVKA